MFLQDAEKGRQRRSRIVQILNVPQRVRLRSSLAAALLNSLFEHPAALLTSAPTEDSIGVLCINRVFRSPLETIAIFRRVAYLARPCSGLTHTHRICAFHPLSRHHRMGCSPSAATYDPNDCSKPTGTASFHGTTTISLSCGGRPIPGPSSFPRNSISREAS